MSVFDAYIRKVAEYVEAMQGGDRRVRVFDCPGVPYNYWRVCL